jgi:chromosome segregation ATPase
MNTDVQRDLGYQEAKIEELENQMRALREDFGEMRNDIAAMRTALSEARGSVRVLLAIAALAGSIGGAIVKFYTMLKGGA